MATAMSTLSTLSTLSVLTREPAVGLVLTIDAAPASTAPQPTAWLPAAIEALQAFRDHD